jgi:murein DD-endopeptidase MepM/ murein hydrolase activator NlpD
MRRRSPRGPRRARLLVLLLALPVLLGGVIAGPVSAEDELSAARQRQRQLHAAIVEQREALAELKAAEADVRAAIQRTTRTLKGITADQAVARADIAAAQAALRKVQARYDRLVARLEHLDWTIDVLEQEQEQSAADLAQRRRLLSQRLAEAYRSQRVGLLQHVFSADSFMAALSDASNFLSFGDQDAQLAEAIERDQKSLDEMHRTTTATRYRTDQLRVEVRQQAVRIRQQREELKAAKRRLDALAARTRRIHERQQANYERLGQNRREAAQQLRRQLAAEQRLAADIARLVDEARRRSQSGSGGAAPPPMTGAFIWPMNGYVSQEFGCTGFSWEPPLGDCAHFHKGIDLVAPLGTPVKAAGSGQVVFTGFNPYDPPYDPAWIVIIEHGNGLVTWYAHLQPRIPTGAGAGAYVSAGEVIGYEGNTGRSTGAHLHWAVLRYGNWVNPRLYV